MGLFDSSKKKKPEDSSREMKPKTPSDRRKTVPGKWQVGKWIVNHYEVRDIKSGGMGIVYITWDEDADRMLAIKTLQDKFISSKEAKDRFVSEATTWVNLERHTNIVYAHFVVNIDEMPYVFLEYVKGGDLSQNIGKLDISHTLDFTIQFCIGMDYANKELGIIHRDIKPQNIMITTEGVLKVTDFGLATTAGRTVLGEKLGDDVIVVSRGMGT